MFHEFAQKRDLTLVSFFRNEWNKAQNQRTIINRRFKPSYSNAQMQKKVRPARLSLNQLVFEALGSTINWEEFVLLDGGINGAKKLLWSEQNPMELKKYKTAYTLALTGARPSGDYLSGLRTVRRTSEPLPTQNTYQQ